MPRSCRLLLTIPHSLCQRPLWTGKGKCQCCRCWGRGLRDTESRRDDMETKGSLFPNSLYIFIFCKSTISIYVEECECVCVSMHACVCVCWGVMSFLFYKLPKWSTLSGTLLWVLSLFLHIHHVSFLWQSRPHIIMDHHRSFSGSFFLLQST